MRCRLSSSTTIFGAKVGARETEGAQEGEGVSEAIFSAIVSNSPFCFAGEILTGATRNSGTTEGRNGDGIGDLSVLNVSTCSGA